MADTEEEDPPGMAPLEADDYETVDSADEDDDDWDADQYGEVVVEGDFEGDAAQSDAGAAEAAEPEPEQLADSRVWGIDNDALEALKAKTAKLARPGSIRALTQIAQPGDKLRLPTHYTQQYRIWTTVQEFKEKSRIFPWDQIFRSRPGPSYASVGGLLQRGPYDSISGNHSQIPAMSLTTNAMPVAGGTDGPARPFSGITSGLSEGPSSPPSAGVALIGSGSGHTSLDFGGSGATPGATLGQERYASSRKWDDTDDTLLLALHTQWSGNWEQIVSHFNKQPGEGRTRTKKAMQHRFSTLQRARRASETFAAPHPAAAGQLNGFSSVSVVPHQVSVVPPPGIAAAFGMFKTAPATAQMPTGGVRAADTADAASDVPVVPQAITVTTPPDAPASMDLG